PKMQVRQAKQSDCLAIWCLTELDFSKKLCKPMLATAFTIDTSANLVSTNGSNSYLQLVSCNLTVDSQPPGNSESSANQSVEFLQPIGQQLLVPNSQTVTQIAWTGHADNTSIVCGFNNGTLALCPVNNLLLRDDASSKLLWQQSGHGSLPQDTGSVVCLTASKMESSVLCSANSEGAVCVWDAHCLEAGPTVRTVDPGSSEGFEAVRCVSWNRQVAQVFGAITEAAAGVSRLAVYDTRRGRDGSLLPLMQLTAADCGLSSGQLLTLLEWHPGMATQLCLASDDNQRSQVQLWDLRFATSPVTQFNGHAGASVLSMAWSEFDTGCLLSSDSSGGLLCWDPKPIGGAVGSIPDATGADIVEPCQLIRAQFEGRTAQNLDWCPSKPGLFSASTSDGQFGIYNILGGGFGIVDLDDKDYDGINEGQLKRLRTPSAAEDPFAKVRQPLGCIRVQYNPARPFSWLLTSARCGASFGFGGRLVSFGGQPGHVTIGVLNAETIGPVDSLIARRAAEFESALANAGDELGSYCGLRSIESSPRQSDCNASNSNSENLLWRLLEANFSTNPRSDFIRLLGYGEDDDECQLDGNETDDLIVRALVSGRVQLSVDLCVANKRYCEALLLASISDGVAKQSQLFSRTRTRVLSTLNNYDSISSLVGTVVSGNIVDYVRNAGIDWKQRLAVVLSFVVNNDESAALIDSIGHSLIDDENSKQQRNSASIWSAAVCYACSGSWRRLVHSLLLLVGNDSTYSSLIGIQLALQAGEILRRAVGSNNATASSVAISDAFVERYAWSLTGLGELSAALNCCLRQLEDRLTQQSYSVTEADVKLHEFAYRLWQVVATPGTTIPSILKDPFAERAAINVARLVAQPGSGYAPPPPSQPGSGYAPPPPSQPGSGYAPPPPSQPGSGYAPPPPSQPGSGYAPPPPSQPGSGYAPPPPSQPGSGYAPPPPSQPGSGYAPPPPSQPGSGYAPPPPSQPGSGYAPLSQQPSQPGSGYAPPSQQPSQPGSGYAPPPPSQPGSGYAPPPPGQPGSGYAPPSQQPSQPGSGYAPPPPSQPGSGYAPPPPSQPGSGYAPPPPSQPGSGYAPPPPSQPGSGYAPPPPGQPGSGYAPPSQQPSQPGSGYAPPSQQPSQPGSGYAPPPPSQPGSGYAPPPPSQPGSGYAPPPPSQPGSGYAPPSQQPSQPGSGYAPPSQQPSQPGSGYAPPSQQPSQPGSGYAPPPPSQPGSGYAPPPPSQPGSGYAPPPNQPGSGYAPPSQQPSQPGSGYAPPPPSQPGSGYAPPPPSQPGSGYAPPPPSQPGSGYAPPPNQPGSGYAPPPPSQPGSGYAPPPNQPGSGYAPPSQQPSQPGSGYAPPPPSQPGSGYALPPSQPLQHTVATYSEPASPQKSLRSYFSFPFLKSAAPSELPLAISTASLAASPTQLITAESFDTSQQQFLPANFSLAYRTTHMSSLSPGAQCYNPLVHLPTAATQALPPKPPPTNSQTTLSTESMSLFREKLGLISADAASAGGRDQVQSQFYNPTAWSAAVAAQTPPPASSSSAKQVSSKPLESSNKPANTTGPVANELSFRLPAALINLSRDCRNRAENLLRMTPPGGSAVKWRHMIVKMNDAEKRATALAKLLANGDVSKPVLDGLGSILTNLERDNLPDALACLNSAVQCGSFVEMRSFMPSFKLLIQTAIDMRQV
ncbi:hypothetical protein BOX15_Mlig002026g6, partial [Macrostomum lignano]